MSIYSEIERIVREVDTQETDLAGTESQLAEALTLLDGKASGGGGGSRGNLSKYAKITAKPTSSTVFTIENPLGGIAKKVFVKAISEPTTSVDIRRYIADYDLGFGAIELASTTTTRAYTANLVTTREPNNGEFSMTDGVIKLYRFNSANVWGANAEYEVEIYE